MSAAKRIDLHCHSHASNKSAEAVLNALHCPESYSKPEEVYAQAKLRGMDFVTLTDHDCIDGALAIAHKPDVLVSEELSCWFPEDGCKMHVLVFGIDRADHDALQSRAKNIYDVAEYIESRGIAHSVAHPIYRQNDKLERWHLERLMLLFKGFECLNGAHSPLHREAFEPLLDRLTPQEIARLSETHNLAPRWQQPWIKARTGGSDDHGLLNVGRTWTEFPADALTTQQMLQHLREGRCQVGGEAGSSAKLAHTFYSVAVRYYTHHIMRPQQKPNIATTLLQTITGERAIPNERQLAMMKLKSIFRRKPKPVAGTKLLKQIFLSSALQQFQQHSELRETIEKGLPALGEHEQMFDVFSNINRDVTEGLAAAISRSVDDASFTDLFDTIGAVFAQQFVLLPYYFALFHQNKEQHFLKRERHPLRVGLFTDTFDEMNGVARFVRDMSEQSQRRGFSLMVHTCGRSPGLQIPGRLQKNFVPLLSKSLPYYEELQLNLPPVLEILQWSDRQQFDAIHVSTPGPMGLCGWLVSKMLRVPMLTTYHTDFPAYAEKLTGDHRITRGTTAYMKWFYGQAAAVFTRSNAYRFNLRDLGVGEEKLRTIPAGVDLRKFHTRSGKEHQKFRLLYCGRISAEKNLSLLVESYAALSRKRPDVMLIVAGTGPYLEKMRKELAGLPAQILGKQDDDQLAALYANCDLFVFPSRTDTLGQAVMEAQACGLPAIVSNEGGPKEIVEHNITGLVLGENDPLVWRDAILSLLEDKPRRQRMSRAAASRMHTMPIERTFESFWADHLAAVEPPLPKEPAAYNPAAVGLSRL